MGFGPLALRELERHQDPWVAYTAAVRREVEERRERLGPRPGGTTTESEAPRRLGRPTGLHRAQEARAAENRRPATRMPPAPGGLAGPPATRYADPERAAAAARVDTGSKRMRGDAPPPSQVDRPTRFGVIGVVVRGVVRGLKALFRRRG